VHAREALNGEQADASPGVDRPVDLHASEKADRVLVGAQGVGVDPGDGAVADFDLAVPEGGRRVAANVEDVVAAQVDVGGEDGVAGEADRGRVRRLRICEEITTSRWLLVWRDGVVPLTVELVT
jgi:hypothetical protein